MVDRFSFDIVILGVGIAGASVAAALGGGIKIALVEQEQQPGYHSTGRSAAYLYFLALSTLPISTVVSIFSFHHC